MSDIRILAVILLRCAQSFVTMVDKWLKTGVSPFPEEDLKRKGYL